MTKFSVHIFVSFTTSLLRFVFRVLRKESGIATSFPPFQFPDVLYMTLDSIKGMWHAHLNAYELIKFPF